jgi:UPF0755 protein
MLSTRDKLVIIIGAVIFFMANTLIFASIPMNIDKERINVVVKSGTGLSAIAHHLKEEGLISSSYLFMICSLLHRGKLIAGEYELGKDMSIMTILKRMGHGERNIYTLRIIEGYNLYNIADAMAKARIMKSEEFAGLSRNSTFLAGLGISADSLEGYLAPDTYYFSKETDVDKFVEKIAHRTLKIFAGSDVRKRMEELGFDAHKTLTLASMIEKEAKMKEEKPLISAVFHNRLKKGMSLDCDPTVIYGTGIFDGPIRRSHLTTYTPYNTYAFRGLPKGPIANPDRNSIMAALYPAPAEYLYFVSRNDGTHVFSKDMAEHNRFVAKYQRVKNTKNH